MNFALRSINGRMINPIGLGCMSLSWAYGTPPSKEDGVKLLHRALDLGYDHFDTANIYGAGHNESLIGDAFGRTRDRIFLATKMGIVVDGPKRGVDCSPAAIRASIDASLARLKTDHVDLYYMHRFDPKVPIAEMAGTMGELIAEGKIGSYGVSEWSAPHIREAHDVTPMAAVQTEYSLWTRNPEIAVLETCRELGISFVAFSPVGRGVLAGGVDNPEDLPETDLRRKMPRFSADNWPKNRVMVDEFLEIAADLRVSPARLSLSWVLAQGQHVVAIPGTGVLAHLEENIADWDWRLPDDIRCRLDALINQRTVSGHRYPEVIRKTIDTEEFA